MLFSKSSLLSFVLNDLLDARIVSKKMPGKGITPPLFRQVRRIIRKATSWRSVLGAVWIEEGVADLVSDDEATFALRHSKRVFGPDDHESSGLWADETRRSKAIGVRVTSRLPDVELLAHEC